MKFPFRQVPGDGPRLLAASAAVLFQELLFIRWMSTDVRVLAYFPNILLIGAFLGLGAGSLAVDRRPSLWAWPLLLAAAVGTTLALSRIVFSTTGASEHLWLLYYDLPPSAPVVHSVFPAIALAFLVASASFFPLGQFIADRLRTFQNQNDVLRGYLWELTGSLAGVGFFAGWTAAEFPPAAGFLLLGALAAALPVPRRGRWIALPIALLAWPALRADRSEVHTPYYALRSVPSPRADGRFDVLANGGLHQVALPLKKSDDLRDEYAGRAREGYHAPYEFLPSPLEKVLVLGAGTGNDVAVLLDRGAKRVDAVEIDPGILAFGRRHPDRPYQDPRVRAINADARQFLQRSTDTYDLIVLGTLDSMTRLSALSNVRLDNYIYTREALAALHRRLNPHGGVVMFFMVAEEHIQAKLVALLTTEFGRCPAALRGDFNLFNHVFMAGPAYDHLNRAERDRFTERFQAAIAEESVPVDDWPYLYLKTRGLPTHYRSIAVFVFFCALATVLALGRTPGRSVFPRSSDAVMFLFGVGFLLLETRAVTALNLLWGATWITSTVVFASILAMSLASTALGRRWSLRWTGGAVGLLVVLAVAYLFPPTTFAAEGPGGRLLASLLLAGLPVFFAGWVFADFFRHHPSSPRGFAWNMLGAVAGGLLESLSMTWGFRNLILLAVVIYLAAFKIHLSAAPSPAAPPST